MKSNERLALLWYAGWVLVTGLGFIFGLNAIPEFLGFNTVYAVFCGATWALIGIITAVVLGL